MRARAWLVTAALLLAGARVAGAVGYPPPTVHPGDTIRIAMPTEDGCTAGLLATDARGGKWLITSATCALRVRIDFGVDITRDYRRGGGPPVFENSGRRIGEVRYARALTGDRPDPVNVAVIALLPAVVLDPTVNGLMAPTGVYTATDAPAAIEISGACTDLYPRVRPGLLNRAISKDLAYNTIEGCDWDMGAPVVTREGLLVGIYHDNGNVAPTSDPTRGGVGSVYPVGSVLARASAVVGRPLRLVLGRTSSARVTALSTSVVIHPGDGLYLPEYNVECAAGFGLVGPHGEQYVMTLASCVEFFNTADTLENKYPPGARPAAQTLDTRQRIGEFVYARRDGFDTDVALIRLAPGVRVVNEIAGVGRVTGMDTGSSTAPEQVRYYGPAAPGPSKDNVLPQGRNHPGVLELLIAGSSNDDGGPVMLADGVALGMYCNGSTTILIVGGSSRVGGACVVRLPHAIGTAQRALKTTLRLA